jgi:hypothetical protein
VESKQEDPVDFSKLKLEVYDFVGIVLPGLLVICEAWIAFKGWADFLMSIDQISRTSLFLLAFLAFGLGHAVQELSDVSIKALKGKRYFRLARDTFWISPDAKIVRNAINREFGQEIQSVDAAFNYCLTRLNERFVKRDSFIATSDLCRSLVILSALALIPVIRITLFDLHPFYKSLFPFAILLVLLGSIAMLAWKRMVRFRALAETTVFHAYLGTCGSLAPAPGARTSH